MSGYTLHHIPTLRQHCDETGPVITVSQGAGKLRINSGCQGLALRHSYKPVLR